MQGERFEVGDRVQCISHEDLWVKEAECKVGAWYTIEEVRDRGHSIRLSDQPLYTIVPLILQSTCFRKEDLFLTRFKEIIADEETT